ncbi:fibronectin type III domain-containing protein [Saccharothrix luteola]|uniref:fibronectin type III domain-containing protein n=1 Tax=Saccharothrix luteola TaxID=2893018 RepID=UPI001E4148FF|nr:fibronectin type III domain-containing protein [Saccharothrix luteola]MCC8248237.1 fibronectin type III domain-containing protein [Saccharothrix luteola]
MERRRIALVTAGVVLFAGVITVLRTEGVGEPVAGTSASAPPPTSLEPYAAEGVLAPTAGPPPESPREVRVTSGPRRLQLRWDGDAPGYEVRWGEVGRLDRTRLITERVTQLDGLEDERMYEVAVSAVDAFGQRSSPARSTGTPHASPAGDYALEDRFDQPDAPDPTRWRLASRGNCARATPGQHDDGRRLVLGNNCAAAPATLRSRTPFVLRDADELGRFVVETDAPGGDGELVLDLVPGPVSLVSGDALPPDAVRLRVATSAGTTSVQVLVPAGTPTEAVRAVPALETGLSHRWELVLRRDGARVLLDGDLVATSPAVPAWREATALVSVAGPTGQRAAISLIAFDAAEATAPPWVPGPDVEVAVAAEAAVVESRALPGVTGGQLRMALLHTDASPQAPSFSVSAGGVVVPARPAAAGAPWRAGVAYPLVADLPAEALRVGSSGKLAVTLVTGLRVQATHVDLELSGSSSGTPPSTAKAPVIARVPELPRVNGTVLDASGQTVPEGAAVQPGRMVFDLVLEGRTGVLLAGLAGFSVRVDDDRVAVVPTASGGPGIAGRYRFALNTSGMSSGPHLIEVRLFGTSGETRPTSAYIPFFVGR